MSGQALVETAIVMPVLLFLLLGIVGVGYLFVQAERDQQAVGVLAHYATIDTNWRSQVNRIDEQSGCHASPMQPDLDGDVLTWDCHLSTGWMFDGLLIRVRALVGPQPSPAP